MPIPQSKVFRVAGMWCQHCKKTVEDMVGKLSGVESVNVDLEAGTVEVKYNLSR